MKQICLLFIFSLLFIKSNAQTDSTLEQLKTSVLYMSDNLDKCHKEFKSGVLFSLLGMASITISTFMPLDTRIDGTKETSLAETSLLYVGGVAALIGVITIWDSHKYIGRAGRVKSIPGGVAIVLK